MDRIERKMNMADMRNSKAGKVAKANGFYVMHSGGGCWHLAKNLANGNIILIDDGDAKIDHNPEVPRDWELGLCTADMEGLKFHRAHGTLRNALLRAEEILTAPDPA